MLPSDWCDFLRNSQNKEDLFHLLGSYALQITAVHTVTNIGTEIRSSAQSGTRLAGLNVTGEEADGRILLHVQDMVLHGASKITVHTVDSDVLIIAIS